MTQVVTGQEEAGSDGFEELDSLLEQNGELRRYGIDIARSLEGKEDTGKTDIRISPEEVSSGREIPSEAVGRAFSSLEEGSFVVSEKDEYLFPANQVEEFEEKLWEKGYRFQDIDRLAVNLEDRIERRFRQYAEDIVEYLKDIRHEKEQKGAIVSELRASPADVVDHRRLETSGKYLGGAFKVMSKFPQIEQAKGHYIVPVDAIPELEEAVRENLEAMLTHGEEKEYIRKTLTDMEYLAGSYALSPDELLEGLRGNLEYPEGSSISRSQILYRLRTMDEVKRKDGCLTIDSGRVDERGCGEEIRRYGSRIADYLEDEKEISERKMEETRAVIGNLSVREQYLADYGGIPEPVASRALSKLENLSSVSTTSTKPSRYKIPVRESSRIVFLLRRVDNLPGYDEEREAIREVVSSESPLEAGDITSRLERELEYPRDYSVSEDQVYSRLDDMPDVNQSPDEAGYVRAGD